MGTSSVESVATLKPGSLGRLGEGLDTRNPRLALAIALAAMLAFVLAITLPFTGQALHIDDAIFWDFARTNLEHPFQQHIQDYRLMGQEFQEWRDTHPPLDQIFLAAVMGLTGSQQESTLHLGYILFPLIAAVSMFFLARRFTKNPLLAVLILLATPAVMTMSHTLMGDVPMFALWLAAAAAYVLGVDRDDNRLLALSGLMAVLAVFAGYQAIVLVLLLPLYALLMRKLSLRTAWPMALPLIGFGLYCLFSLWRYDALPRFKHAGGLSLERSHLLERLQGTLLQAGGASVFPLIMLGVFSLRRKRYLALPVIAAASAALGIYHQTSSHYPLASTILFTVFLTAGVVMAYAVISETALQAYNLVRRRDADRDYFFLGVWLLAILGIVVLLLPHATAKYTLPFLAPLVLIMFLEMEKGIRSARLMKWLAVAAFALTLMAGSLVSAADYRLAQGNRDFALGFAERYEPQGRVWFVGEWGFRHYMESQDYTYLSSTNESPREGDIVVRAEFSDWPLAGPVRERMQLIGTDEIDWNVPLRVMSFRSSAGFYGTHWGDLPYAITAEPVERFEIYRIGP